MIRVPFPFAETDPMWAGWRKRAERRTRTLLVLLEAGQAYKISDALYKEPRQIYLSVFHGKCAYCESKVTQDQHHGDVEHFRPKGRVTDESGAVVEVGGKPHRGYPWLAYNPGNLLPACVACNRPGTIGRERFGKWDQFPVAGRFRALKPGEEEREKPLLLHPGFDNPEDHLELQLKTGRLRGKTKRGTVTIRILGLNREGLFEERRAVALHVCALVTAARCALDNGDYDLAGDYIGELARFRQGSAPLSWAGRLTLDALGGPVNG